MLRVYLRRLAQVGFFNSTRRRLAFSLVAMSTWTATLSSGNCTSSEKTATPRKTKNMELLVVVLIIVL